MAIERRKPRTPAKRDYTAEQVELGLLAVAYANGNTRKAARELKTANVKVPPRTLWDWSRKSRLEDYERVRRKVLPKIQQRAAEQHMGIAEAGMEVQEKMLTRLGKESGNLEIKDVSTASRNLAVTVGIHAEKAQLLAGEPTQIVHRSADEVLRALKAKGVLIDQEPPVIEAEVIEE
jgi:hypothetical protein